MYTILVADDERWIRKGIARMIDRESNEIGEVYEAESVKQALEIFKEKLPDILLSDVIFPAENGCDLGRQIYELRPETKIVMISAYDDFYNAQKALQFRAVDYLLKPVTKEQLNNIVSKCIQQLETSHEQPDDKLMQLDLSKLLEEDDSTVFMIEKLMKKIRNNPAKHYNLADMAKECHVTGTYFSTLFKKTVGISPMNYVAQIRVEKALEIIQTTDYKFVQVAQAVGYTDYQYFTKVFKKVTGESPGEFRNRISRETENE